MSESLQSVVGAVLAESPAAVLSQHGAHEAQLHLPELMAPVRMVALDAAESSELRRRASQLIEEVKPGEAFHLLVVGNAEVATPILKALIPSMLLQVRKQLSASVWAPGGALVSVRGAVPSALLKATKRLARGESAPPPTEANEAARSHGAEAQAFAAALNQRRPMVTYAVVAASAVMFALQWLWGQGEPVRAAVRMGAALSSRVAEGEVWRLLSVMMLHGSVMHVVLNLLALLSFGPFLERLLGSRRYLIIYVLSGLGGSLLSLLHPVERLSVGASGGIWGLMVAGAVVSTWPRGLLPTVLHAQLRTRAWTPVVINALYSFKPGIDFLAHAGGGVAGGLLVVLLAGAVARPDAPDAAAKPPRRERAWVTLASAVLGVALLASVGAAFATGRPWQLLGAPVVEHVALPQSKAHLDVPRGARVSRVADTQWVVGTLDSDGVVFIIALPEQQASDEELQNPKAVLDDVAAEVTKAGQALDGMKVTKQAEVVSLRDGRLAVFSEQHGVDRDDERVAWQWWTLDGRQLVMVTVVSFSSQSPEKLAAYQAMAQSLKLTALE